MNIVAVTTFNEGGLEKYGRRMMQTFDRHWSMGVKLHVYYEGWNPYQLDYETWNKDMTSLVFKHLITSSDWLRYFKHRHRDKKTENFRLDAVRFSHKIAALLHAAEDKTLDYLIWLDGDIVAHSDFDAEHLDTLLPKDKPIAWLDRAGSYPECGFYILNMRHIGTFYLLNMLRSMYADDKLFELKEWHDSYVLQQCVLQLKLPVMSLSGPAGRQTYHPFVNGPLGQWFDHLKGKRKNMKRTPKIDIHVPRTEEYWRS